jgi:sugar phosphate isomerase/epimerase
MVSKKLAFASYTVRTRMNDRKEIEETLLSLGAMGYSAVELDPEGWLLKFDKGELRDLLRRAGIRPFSTHIQFERLEQTISQVIEIARSLGLQYVVVPSLPRDRFCKDEKGWIAGTQILSRFAEKFAESNLKFAYHNHSEEFEKFNGKTAMEIVFDESLWKNYLVELDTHWVQYGGGDPAEWIARFRDHVPLVHLKDLGIVKGKPMTLEVGQGNLNWTKILDACEKAGVDWYIVEQDDTLRDPVESLEISKKFLNEMSVL